MALLGMWGFDDNVHEPDVSISGGITNYGNARTGVGGCYWTNMTSPTALTFPITASATVISGFGIYNSSGYGTVRSWITVSESGTVHLSVRFDSSGHLVLYRGDAVTVLATSTTSPIPNNVWKYVEIKATISDTTGYAEIRVDGTAVITYSGDTRNGGTSGVVDTFQIGTPINGGGWYMGYDDVYIVNDTGVGPYNDFLGDVVVRTLLPNGNGSSSGWVNSAGNSTNNSTYVDEPNSSMSDYVAASVSGTSDLYALTDIPTSYNVLGTQMLVYATKSDAGTSPIIVPQAKGPLGTIRTDTALPALSTTAQVFSADLRTTDPDGNPLTASGINSTEIGAQIQ